MNDKEFTDELFRRMYSLGYRKAEIENDVLFFFNSEREILNHFLPRVKVASTCFGEKNQFIDVAEYLGIVDWSKVAVDTPILVKDDCEDKWVKSYFASYKNGEVRAWMGGRTSFSVKNKTDTFGWKYAKLAEV